MCSGKQNQQNAEEAVFGANESSKMPKNGSENDIAKIGAKFRDADNLELLAKGCEFLAEIKEEKHGLIGRLAEKVNYEACLNRATSFTDQLLHTFQENGPQILAQIKAKEIGQQNAKMLSEFGTLITAFLAQFSTEEKHKIVEAASNGKKQQQFLMLPSNFVAFLFNKIIMNFAINDGETIGKFSGNSGMKISENFAPPTTSSSSSRHVQRRFRRDMSPSLWLAFAFAMTGFVHNSKLYTMMAYILIVHHILFYDHWDWI
ncbi:hypothetical protein niasHT_003023 [Heterodera trifolii]|uniref:Uncharacterized protein n=1 Tax=Heterodera trifolii TaxID=157864 RepID=A0ABD2M5Z2_9BILA